MGDDGEMSAVAFAALCLARRTGRRGTKPKQACTADRRAAKKRQRDARRKGSR